MLDWIIVGGGVHGTYHSLVLTVGAGVPADRVAVIDPYPMPLAAWRHTSGNCAMRHMRSPVVHHLGLDTGDLKAYGAARDHEGYLGRYKRPSLALFNDHCQSVVKTHRLDELRVQGRVSRLGRGSMGWEVETEQGVCGARNVLLAIGLGEQLRWPGWATASLRRSGVRHLFEPGFHLEDAATGDGAVAVVGGGISAAQAALHLAARKPGRVTLVTRDAIRPFEFDSDPCWLGPRCLAGFGRLASLDARRRAILKGRRPGTVPPEVMAACDAVRASGDLVHRVGAIEQAGISEDGTIRLGVGGETVAASTVICATGFGQQRPGGDWLDRAIAAEGLPLSECGYPYIDGDLRWGEGLFVSGPLAELEVGPVARNISGARLAGRRLLRVARAMAR